MGVEQKRGEQYDPVEIAIAELQGPVDLAHLDLIRKAVVENGSDPSTHPLRRGAWLRPDVGDIAVRIGSPLGTTKIDKGCPF